jgi:ubiquinone/menaquinone biosynthesis C-methylase UbiE
VTPWPWASLAVARAEHLPLADASADVVVASTLLSSLPDTSLREAAAREMARVVRPGGRVVVYDLRYPSPRNRAVHRVSAAELRRLFPSWRMRAHSLTLMPPLARSFLGATPRRYRLLSAVPVLRSHIGVVLVRPKAAT